MKKLIIILIINFSILLIVAAVVEFISYKSYEMRYADLIESQASMYSDYEKQKQNFSVKYVEPTPFDYSKMTEDARKTVYDGVCPSVVTIGCSYTAGVGLEKNQTFAYKLNKLTGRKVYNRGVIGTGPQMVYRQFSDVDFKNEVPEAKYFIYTFIYNHIERQFQDLYTQFLGDIDLNYILINGKLVEKKRPYWKLYRFFTVKNILEYHRNQSAKKELNNGLPLFFATMEASVKNMKKLYPDSKFILLEFPEDSLCQKNYIDGSRELSKEQIKHLEKSGIIYINAEKLVGHKFRDIEKYRVKDKDHPNERVWDEIAPALVQKLGI